MLADIGCITVMDLQLIGILFSNYPVCNSIKGEYENSLVEVHRILCSGIVGSGGFSVIEEYFVANEDRLRSALVKNKRPIYVLLLYYLLEKRLSSLTGSFLYSREFLSAVGADLGLAIGN